MMFAYILYVYLTENVKVHDWRSRLANNDAYDQSEEERCMIHQLADYDQCMEEAGNG